MIVVGGRVAGSTLAARLGRAGFRVLLLERDALPSLPAVSSPIIYAPTMAMLDEIGADEAAYAHNTPRLYHMVNVSRAFQARIRIPDYRGRDYAYAVDRARFDAALWDTALRQPGVTGRQQFAVTDLLREGERVVGVIGKARGGATETLHAGLVIGADGRFGVVSRKSGAGERDVSSRYPTSVYYAYWRGVLPLPEGPAAAAYEGDGPYGYLVMDSADGQAAVAIEGRSDIIAPPAGDSEAWYEGLLQQYPALWSRFVCAERVTTVRGMRNVGNLYREPGGPGWALVGDAYHQKDPLDGQGIYDAVATAKALAHSLKRWRQGTLTYEAALADYDETARVLTYGMYKTLQNRIRTSFYAPPALPEQWQRWIADDPAMGTLLGKMLTRQLPADAVTLLAPGIIAGAIARGAVRDFGSQVRQQLRERLPFLPL
ncbi:MAG: NAD(P)/FAD-dependent oxidoreductase [Anaerolineae bacterium]|nr:NAD(P)/FAD-dependent oxidoreductase [Anaerolineae bacterium]